MASMLKWLGDVTEMVVQQRATVVRTEYLDKRLKLVQFESDVVRKRSFQPGQWVQFRVCEDAFRHYTPSAHDAKTGLMEVLFYLHDEGPGSKWADKLQVGEEMLMMGPAGKFNFDPTASHHLFIGDETSIGGCKVMQDALKGKTNYTCLVECEKEFAHWPKLSGLNAKVAIKGLKPGVALLDLVKSTSFPADTTVYLSGHAGSIQAIRKELMTFKGIPNRKIISKAYWAEGKTGL